MLGGIFFSLIQEILHAWQESGRNNVQAGDSLSMRESWKPCIHRSLISLNSSAKLGKGKDRPT